MQRITAAYAAGDLAALLSLLANSDSPSPPSAEAEALLQRYTEALAQQRQQLTQQLATARRPDDQAPWSGTEKQQRTRLREIKRSLRAETEYLDYLLGQLKEPAGLKTLLRELTTRGQTGL
jgi:predicted trehalose synthase